MELGVLLEKVAIAPSLRSGVSSSSRRRRFASNHCQMINRGGRKQQRLRSMLLEAGKINGFHPSPIRTSPNKFKPRISTSGSGSTESTRAILESLFQKTQKLEQDTSHDSSQEVELGLDALLLALATKENHLQAAAERIQKLAETEQALEKIDGEAAGALAEAELVEEALNRAKSDALLQSIGIKELLRLIAVQEQMISRSIATIREKEDELGVLVTELAEKDKEAAMFNALLESKALLLAEAKESIEEQERKIKQLQAEMEEKESGLAELLLLRSDEWEKLKSMEAALERRDVEWLAASEELEELSDQAAQGSSPEDPTPPELKRVESLLDDVKAELFCSLKCLASSRREVKVQELRLETLIEELNEWKLSLAAFAGELEEARMEIHGRGAEMRDAHSRRQGLETEILAKESAVLLLEEELKDLNSAVENSGGHRRRLESLREELGEREAAFADAMELLRAIEAELDEAKLRVRRTKSPEQLPLLLEDGDADELDGVARKELAAAGSEAAELQDLVRRCEEQLSRAAFSTDTKRKCSEAAAIAERISRLAASGRLLQPKEEEDGGETVELELERTEEVVNLVG